MFDTLALGKSHRASPAEAFFVFASPLPLNVSRN
jgi:hypothetical protein